jgi:hypothetical protein
MDVLTDTVGREGRQLVMLLQPSFGDQAHQMARASGRCCRSWTRNSMAGNSFSFVLKNGLYSERYRTLASCRPQRCALLPAKGSCTSILLRETGGRVMYWARASRVLEEAGIFTDMSRLTRTD